MKLLELNNPFGAPLYHEETVSSTFDAARLLAENNENHGTVICADFQHSGRGRLSRPWVTERGKNLLFTILLRYGDFSSIPEALTLKTGLAISLALEDMLPALTGSVKVKWPNDVMIKIETIFLKVAGILAEADGANVYIGAGINLNQKEFPEEYRFKAGSIIQVYPDLPENARFVLLEKILARLYEETKTENKTWREQLSQRLYKKGETVVFAPGAADSESLVEGILSGIGENGELLIIPRGEDTEFAFVSGELRVY